MHRFVFDTTFIVKGLVEPRRTKQDKEFERQTNLHFKAKEYLEKLNTGQIVMIIPSIALVETGCVVARLTNDPVLAQESVDFLKENAAAILFDFETLDTAIKVGIETKASGFDNLYLAVLELTKGILLTDDHRLHELAIEKGFESRLLREMI